MTIKERIAELRGFINGGDAGDPTADTMLAHLDAIEKELEGEREWGTKKDDGMIYFHDTREHAIKRLPDRRLVSRRKAGPWEEEK